MFGLSNSWFKKEKPVFTGYRMGFGVHITPPRGVGFNIGAQAVRVVGAFEQTFSFNDGDAITADVSGYYTFRIRGAQGGSTGGNGGTTLAEVYMTAGSPLYVKSIYQNNSPNTGRSGGEGIAITTTNSLDPSTNRPTTTVIVAGGGGGRSSNYGGAGGGWTGGSGRGENPGGGAYFVGGGSQQGGGGGSGPGSGSGGVWYGGQGGGGSQGWGPGGGGGHGWYGGGGAGGDNQNGHGGGGGASGYISNSLRTPNTHGHLKVGTASTTTQGGGGQVGENTPQGGATLEIRSTPIT